MIRDGDRSDRRFLRTMLVEANHGPASRATRAELLREPMVARYLEGWGRPGDTAVVAIGADGRRQGAAWYRLFTEDAPGWAFIDPGTPELTIAVSRRHRGQGVGRALLAALLDRARAQGRPGMTLSVSLANPAALALYRDAGFRTMAQDHGWATMIWRPREPTS